MSPPSRSRTHLRISEPAADLICSVECRSKYGTSTRNSGEFRKKCDSLENFTDGFGTSPVLLAVGVGASKRFSQGKYLGPRVRRGEPWHGLCSFGPPSNFVEFSGGPYPVRRGDRWLEYERSVWQLSRS